MTIDVASQLAELGRRLRSGETVSDDELDAVYPPAIRRMSSAHFTPVCVARRAAELLVRAPSDVVLDVGAGAGKMCIVGAATSGARFVGIERRSHLVRVAEDAARRLGVLGATFQEGDLDAIDPADLDAAYLYNPFAENIWSAREQLDHTVELSEARFTRDVARARALLERTRAGTRVATYHGFGGEMPACFGLATREWRRGGYLDLWVKAAA